MKTLYVGNLPWRTSEEDLREFFSPYAKVGDVRIITDRLSGRSRGFGFVEVDDDTDVESLIQELNGKILGERELVVSEARERAL